MKINALVAEFIGTFALVFIGAGTAAVGLGGLLGVALAHAFVIVGMAYSYGHISGAHLNPAVSIGLWIGQKLETMTMLGYVVVQFLGGIAAAATLYYLLGGSESGLGATVLVPMLSPLKGVIIEAILTFFLVNAVFNTTGNHAGLAIGLTLGFCILMGGPLTGASLNPARTLGPALLTGNVEHLVVYMVGPLVGAAVAAFLYQGCLKRG